MLNLYDCSAFISSKRQLSVSSNFSSFRRPVQLIPLWSGRICEFTKVLGFAATKVNFKRTGVRHWFNNLLLMALSIWENLVSGGWGPPLQRSAPLQGCAQQAECCWVWTARHGGESIHGRVQAVLQRSHVKHQQYVNLSPTPFFLAKLLYKEQLLVLTCNGGRRWAMERTRWIKSTVNSKSENKAEKLQVLAQFK